ncbi:MAG TPA: hypothetical protein VEY09_03850 [Pyrinomonadaceae bacterium]|nr:hypothetical protein [Pyrinomonadaceae bacterium]
MSVNAGRRAGAGRGERVGRAPFGPDGRRLEARDASKHAGNSKHADS